MSKFILLLLAVYFAGLAAWLIIHPLTFYQTIPGVPDTGPFNDHFSRDVGFAFLVSAAGLWLGAIRGDKTLAVLGAAFPVLHGVFHVVGIGQTEVSDIAGILGELLPTAGIAAVALIFALRLKGVPS
ncbi:hypothetical protein MNBD_ALPHA07-531 [hydrothermal vent metagenome]|uniref:Uncharacterized protein n=1 Tax=hydrothermal vent metagenome TaxID=652676 RepID=A0A3B0SG41_9ZZZZ